MSKQISAKEAAELISDGATLGIGGFIGTGVAEEIHLEVEKRFTETGKPENLTLLYAAGIGDGKEKGLNHYAHEGLVKKVIGGHWGLAPKLQPLVAANKIEAYNLPQGVISQMMRDSAAGKPRTITHVGLGTFVDPDVDGGKLNDVTTENIVEKISLDGSQYLAYKTQKINIAILKGTEADELGNISFGKEPLTLEVLSIAMNAKNNGGLVIVQVERMVKNGTIDPKLVKIPGILVDYVVVVENIENHMQTFGTQYNEAFVRSDIVVKKESKVYPLNERKVIARRAAMLLSSDKKVLNYGIGVPEVIAEVLREEGQEEGFIPTIEPGAVGGTPAGGLDFGCTVAPQAIIDQPYMFDFYDGGGIDAAFLGLAQCDEQGNINVSKFGPKIAGCGGFINITQNAGELAFCGTFTAGGLKVNAQNGQLQILQEGKAKKFIKSVEQITFSGNVARENAKKVLYITERAVFELRPEGLTLTEIAPGIDIGKDILDQMDFTPIIAEELKTMDERIFMDEPMGLNFENEKKTEAFTLQYA
ncbi:acyl CoA:acetate/3-ketoacid CoA transferase [Cytobacillus spongiae]|uniref:acyl CoA:acetate/3-ketoacid CoA transferase n=1 Tax=Cytobacillus spongiae TaxID=2901381 RepID=UPI001F3C6748|nr:acyl CoA:acetate/3-ketoacid CoA transferase [Cytobacillus spongiae]UII57883.1 acyl CoA:acetate/3-ketoacid CoA transferase [Cytobacillus spongiae]